MAKKKSGGIPRRRVRKRKEIEKQWRKGTARWRYDGMGESDHDTVERKLSAPRQFASVLPEGEREALVVQTGGPDIVLLDRDTLLLSRPRRSTTSENPASTLIAVGDRVRYIDSEECALITHVYLRQSWLLRSSIRAKEYGQVLVANIDEIIIVAAATQEQLRSGLIDRYLVATAMGGLSATICINKMDLVEDDDENAPFVEDLMAMYRDTGYRVLSTSCVTGEGIEELSSLVTGKLSAFSGHSGVGKTSLLNELIPDLEEKTQELSEQSQRGIHTTTTSMLYPLPDGGYLADTPGIREFGMFQFDGSDLHTYYPEFLRHADDCRYPGCTHTHEPDCAVQEAVEHGDVHVMRYRNYLQILESEEQ